jgi:hypothetical protein
LDIIVEIFARGYPIGLEIVDTWKPRREIVMLGGEFTRSKQRSTQRFHNTESAMGLDGCLAFRVAAENEAVCQDHQLARHNLGLAVCPGSPVIVGGPGCADPVSSVGRSLFTPPG